MKKNFIFLLFFTFFSLTGIAQDKSYQLSSHILDIHTGKPKLTYQVGPYFEAQGQDSFYPFIEVVFQIKDNAHYHVPITLSPYGYSTYRGN